MDRKTLELLAQKIKVNKDLHKALKNCKTKYGISIYQCNQLIAVYNFMLEHPQFTDCELRRIFKMKNSELGFVLKCEKRVENFFELLRANGVVYTIEKINEFQVLNEQNSNRNLN